MFVLLRRPRVFGSIEATTILTYGDLQICSSVWSCPCCSNYISEKRRVELNALLAYARKTGLFPVMLTLTVKHSKNNCLDDLLKHLKGAKMRLINHRAYTTLKPQIIGSVTATEVTGGGFNGWHPHFHIVLLVKANTETEAVTLIEKLRNPWLVSLKAEGLEGSEAAFQVQSAKAAGNYIAKWGVAEELSLGGKKKGRSGRTPFQLLADYAEGDIGAGYLFQEYSRVFKGRKQLVWSPGLKDLAGIKEMSDEKVAAEEVRRFEESKLDEWIKSFGHIMWTFHRYKRAEILEEVEESKKPKPPTSSESSV
ncbi:MAG: hypothetical protein DDT27_01308 [Dehalococcoidia bacterium]|nr:hypothetical protein [Chloroflexota bacterium]